MTIIKLIMNLEMIIQIMLAQMNSLKKENKVFKK